MEVGLEANDLEFLNMARLLDDIPKTQEHHIPVFWGISGTNFTCAWGTKCNLFVEIRMTMLDILLVLY